MRIVLLTNIISPYRKVFYDKLACILKDKNVEFHVLVMAETEPNRQWKYEEYKGDYMELLTSRTVRIKNIFLHFNKDMKSKLKELRPDILIASGSYLSPSVIKAIFLKKELKYRLFFWSESHQNELRSYNRLILLIRNLIRRKIYQSFDGFWYAGKKSLDFIHEFTKQKKTTKEYAEYFIPNLVDPNLYQKAGQVDAETKKRLCEEYGIESGKFVFLLPARLAPEKGILPFIALLIQCSFKSGVTVLILGEGEMEEEIRYIIKSLSIDIRLLGYQKQEATLGYYSIADCFLLPSLSDPNPLSCIEALWAGLPLLVSEHVGNYPEVVLQGQNGYVFSYKEPEIALEYMNRIITSDNTWREQASQLSLNLAKDLFEPDRAVGSLVKEMLTDYDQHQ